MSECFFAMFGTMPGGDDDVREPACMERAITYLSAQDQCRFRKEFRNRAGNKSQMEHMFRELLAGAFIARQGFTPRYEPDIDGRTPDWHFKSNGLGEFIAEFRNFHSPESVRSEQQRALDGEAPRLWSGVMQDNTRRLWQAMQLKAGKYKAIATQLDVPYVVIVHGLFTAALMPGEVEACILPADGLFEDYPDMSGVFHMCERPYKSTATIYHDGVRLVVEPKPPDMSDSEAGYRFDFYPNPKANRPTPWLTGGLLPYRFPARATLDGNNP
jgi:hypothetical protein